MALTNPTRLVNVQRLAYFKEKLLGLVAVKDGDAVANNIAKFDSSGNPVDSGKSINDIKPFASTATCQDIVTELT